ncbi:MAG TPA: metallopeptidase family protein [Solirubrobacterales bacterium]|jgi:predicted Zn-dependent protease with MMP-like domain|nr:metallopeptidase family protein [Solirubrobacterales bacterium]
MTYASERPPLSDEETVASVQEALDSLPPEIGSKLMNVAILVEDGNPDENLMGIYDPTGGLQRIVIFRDRHPSAAEVKRTVLHEIGHYFGMDEERVRGWGL